MRTGRTRTRAVLAALIAGFLVVSCSDDGTTASNSDTTATDASGAAEQAAVTIEHRYGSTTIDGRPERIVALDSQWLDVLTALDAPVVAAALDPSIEGGRFPWQDELPEDLTDIPVTDAIPYEAVAAARPDLIVVSWAAPEQADYERLSEIAPTIPLLGDEEVDTWQDMAEVAGRVLGDPDAAADLVASVDQQVAELAAELPGLEGRTYALVNYIAGDSFNVVADPDDGSARVFAQFGMEIDPGLLELADGESGRVALSLERADLLAADMLLLLTNGADPTEIPGYDSLPAVRNDAVAVLGLAEISGLNTPTPLSLPFSLEAIRPQLEAVAGT